MGNICRSPVAEGVMRHLLDGAGLGDRVTVDSAGTGGWHVGAPPDPRSVEAAAGAGSMSAGRRGRSAPTMSCCIDLVLCADGANLRDVLALLPARRP